jgi:hypothetical protein
MDLISKLVQDKQDELNGVKKDKSSGGDKVEFEEYQAMAQKFKKMQLKQGKGEEESKGYAHAEEGKEEMKMEEDGDDGDMSAEDLLLKRVSGRPWN